MFRYPDATAEELATVDNVCIICREEMSGSGSSKKLPCNHIFHASCLRSWFQRQQTCPTCRMDVLRVNIPPNVQNAPPAGGAAQQPPQAMNMGQCESAFLLLLNQIKSEFSLLISSSKSQIQFFFL